VNTDRIDELVASLTIEEKVAVLTGRDFWATVPLERIGLRSVVLSDGPIGVRGETWDDRDPSLCLPSPTALASSWSRDIAERFGVVLAGEARRKGIDVVLGPTINLHRTPYGGRHFECMSEDPLLSGTLAAAYVEGLQSNGVGATPKHYVANDFETDRFTVDVVVGDRALRELYLRPFEDVVGSGAWSVMSSYNSINGATSSENDLLDDPLKTEWGFDGVVISDWTAVRSIHSAEKEQDLVMPGPDGPWGRLLVDAVNNGDISEETIDRKVRRILLLAARVGALESVGGPSTTPAVVDGKAFAREAAIAGSVLVKNEGLMPIPPTSCVALIGHNATMARVMGGGSATVIPDHVVSPLEGFVAAVGEDRVEHALGTIVEAGVADLSVENMMNPVTGGPGVRVTFLDDRGVPIHAEDRRMTSLTYFGGSAPVGDASSISLHTLYRVDAEGLIEFGYGGIYPAVLTVDGTEILRHTPDSAESLDIDGLLKPEPLTASVAVGEGQVIDLMLTLNPLKGVGPLGDTAMFDFGTMPGDSDPDGLIAEAVELAARSDVAVVVVGTNADVESEGFDRTTLALPGRQDDLVRAVSAANPRTVVVVNSGSPVILPWRDEVAAILFVYFPGQEFGHALADVLYGKAEPGGRLPTTWPAAEEDLPIGPPIPVDGKVEYGEGIHIGYRAWLRSGVAPAFPFGHGLGYTTWSLDSMSLPDEVTPGTSFTVTVGVTNTGGRTGKQVLQVYAERGDSAVDRPVRWLIGFADVMLNGGESATVEVDIPTRELANYDGGWQFELGTFDVYAGFSVADTPAHASIRMR
jgi:beta-glucosidase